MAALNTQNGKANSDQEKANELNRFFKEVFTKEREDDSIN